MDPKFIRGRVVRKTIRNQKILSSKAGNARRALRKSWILGGTINKRSGKGL